MAGRGRMNSSAVECPGQHLRVHRVRPRRRDTTDSGGVLWILEGPHGLIPLVLTLSPGDSHRGDLVLRQGWHDEVNHFPEPGEHDDVLLAQIPLAQNAYQLPLARKYS